MILALGLYHPQATRRKARRRNSSDTASNGPSLSLASGNTATALTRSTVYSNLGRLPLSGSSASLLFRPAFEQGFIRGE